MKGKIPKLKKCRECEGQFIQMTSLHVYCSVLCSVKGTQKKREKKESQDWKEKKKLMKEKVKTKSDYIKEAQIVFNQFIRMRDVGKPCISCKGTTGKQNAGHYRSVGACPELRFNELNVNLQCEKCNSFLSGNLIEYRKGLIEKIGITEVEKLESFNEPKRYSIDELIEIKKVYKSKINQLKF